MAKPNSRMSHALRAACDAVLVGVGTVLSDDPQLTVRADRRAGPRPAWSSTRVSGPRSAAAVFSPDAPTYVMTTARRRPPAQAAGAGRTSHRRPRRPAGSSRPGHRRPCWTSSATEGIRSVIVEGGPRVITSMLAAGAVDRVVVSISPRDPGPRHRRGRPVARRANRRRPPAGCPHRPPHRRFHHRRR